MLDDGKRIDIRQGRHPVIETLMPVGEEYIPNDVMLDDKQQQDYDDHRTQHVG